MSWKTSRLSDLCSDVYSGGTPTSNNAAYYGGDIPWLRTQEVTFNRIRETELAITEAGYENSAAKWVPAKSVIVAMYGNSAGRSAVSEIPLTTNQACCNLVIDPARADYRFVFYALLLRYEELKGLAKGAAQNNLNASQVKGFEVSIPPRVEEQQRIADSLSAYDDLIENNRRRIALLEQSARLLYREWFVHLRFPGHEHVKVVDGVPEGWRNSNVGQEADFVGRGITPAYDDEADGLVINQKCIRDRLLNLNQARRQSKVVPDQKIVRFGDVLINSTGEGTLGRVAQVLKEVPNCTVDSHVTIVRPSGRIGSLYLGRAISEFEEMLKTMGRGATNQTELSRDDVSALSILVPSSSIASEFEDQMSPVIRLIVNLLDQNEALSLARDLLLPRLMSGDLVV